MQTVEQENEMNTVSCKICGNDFESEYYAQKCPDCKGKFMIPVENMPYVQTKLEKLNKRADKLGCPRVTINHIDTIKTEQKVKDAATGEETTQIHVWNILEIKGEAPKLNGWELVGTLDHTFVQGHNVVRVVPGKELPVEFRTADNYCEHCRTRRNRKETFVVINEQGEYKKVGRNCIADFLGHADPKGFMSYAEWLNKLEGELEEEERIVSGRYVPTFKLDEYMDWVCEAYLREGWVSRSEAQTYGSMKTSTADRAWSEMNYKPKPNDWRARAKWELSFEALELATKTLQWASQLPLDNAENDFLYNLALIYAAGHYTWKEMGFAAAMLRGYLKTIETKIDAEQAAKRKEESKHMGEVGKRETFTLRVVRMFIREGFYGTSYFYILEDENCNVFTWDTSNGYMDEGSTYELTATVKAHDEYKGTKQTILTRCRVK